MKYMFLIRMDPAMDAVLGRQGDSGCIIARTAQGMIEGVRVGREGEKVLVSYVLG